MRVGLIASHPAPDSARPEIMSSITQLIGPWPKSRQPHYAKT